MWYVYNKWSAQARTKVVRRKHIIMNDMLLMKILLYWIHLWSFYQRLVCNVFIFSIFVKPHITREKHAMKYKWLFPAFLGHMFRAICRSTRGFLVMYATLVKKIIEALLHSTKYILKIYRQTSIMRRNLVDKRIVDHSNVVGASPVGAASTASYVPT